MIRKTLVFNILSLLAIALSVAGPQESSAQTPIPILTLETGMHTGRMMRLAVDPGERFIATAAEDKTVRLWDISGEGAPTLMRILRPPVDPGMEGKLYAVAISHDGNTIACGGSTGWDWEGKASIYLFDRATGAMKKRVDGLPGRVLHITYSPDGRFMAALMTHGGYMRFPSTRCWGETGTTVKRPSGRSLIPNHFAWPRPACATATSGCTISRSSGRLLPLPDQ
jgi:WD40 repeat protein